MKNANLEKNILVSLISLLFLVAPFFAQYHIAGEGLFLPFNIVEWLVMTLIISYSLYILTNKKQLILPKYFWAILFFPLGILISGFVTGIHMPVSWFFRMLFILGGTFFLFSLHQINFTNREINRILLLIVLSSLLDSIISSLQVNFSSQMLHFLPITSNGRPSGAFQQINTNASYLATGLLIAFYLITRPGLRWGDNKKKNLKLALLIITIALSSYVITLSSSRVGALSSTVGFAIILLCRWQQLRRKKILLCMVLCAATCGGLIGSSGLTQLNEKFDKTFEQYSSARMGIYQVSIDIIKQKPLFGHGIGSFDKIFVEQAGHYLASRPEAALAELPSINHPHNEFFLWLIEGGVFSVISIIVGGAAVILALHSVGWSRGGAYSAILIPISLHTQVELPFYLSAIHWFLFLFIIFVILRHTVIIRSFYLSKYFKLMIQICSVLLLVTSSLFLLNCLRVNNGIVQYHQEKTGNVHLLEDALNNIYFNNYAERSIMAMQGISSVAYDQEDKVFTFTQWAEQYIQVHPDYVIREILVKAYSYLGQQENMCETLNHGLFLYPKNKELITLSDSSDCM